LLLWDYRSAQKPTHYFSQPDLCKADILDYKPDELILIDYPGFNLRIAKWAKQQITLHQSGSKIIF